ncbi:MAG: hypothetical protein ACI4EQ_01180 [Lachnospiraceae bacterium]
MEYVVFAAAMLAFVALLIIKGLYDEHREKKKLIERLRYHYGEMKKREYCPEQYASIARYFEKHPQEGQVDDITWNDLGLDDVFKRINDTYSSAGEEMLYYMLRTPVFEEERLQHLEDVVTYFTTHMEERVGVQLALNKLGGTGRFSMYDYLDHLDMLGKRSNLKHWILDALFIPAVIFCMVNASLGILCLVGLMLFNILIYFKEKNEIDTYITSFVYAMKLIETAGHILPDGEKLFKEERELLKKHKQGLNRFKSGSFWLMSSGRMSGSGNPLDILLDYFRMVFHLDLIKFNSMLEQVREHTHDIDMLFSVLGYLDAAIAIGAYRQSVSGEYCVPVLHTEKEAMLKAEELYHPLIENPVKNSIAADRGVLLTGSNASGKSTFLKTVALNAIFAQTIHTVLADSYEGSYFHICSSMALRDDLTGGESYYIVEIRAIKRILDIVDAGKHQVLCFVDEVLRGTNTVERIAASTEILKSLSGKKVICFAATHDVELTHLLADEYENYHFEEEIKDGDVCFNYRLLSGKATTRNAIKLLSVMGYEDRIIDKANHRAEEFMKTGKWEV